MIGGFAKPDEIRFTDVLPKTRSGKIMRRLLRDLASGSGTVGDTTTLEDFSVLAKLREERGVESAGPVCATPSPWGTWSLNGQTSQCRGTGDAHSGPRSPLHQPAEFDLIRRRHHLNQIGLDLVRVLFVASARRHRTTCATWVSTPIAGLAEGGSAQDICVPYARPTPGRLEQVLELARHIFRANRSDQLRRAFLDRGGLLAEEAGGVNFFFQSVARSAVRPALSLVRYFRNSRLVSPDSPRAGLVHCAARMRARSAIRAGVVKSRASRASG